LGQNRRDCSAGFKKSDIVRLHSLWGGAMKIRHTAVLASVIVCVLALASSAHATFPGANGKIAFGTHRDGNYEIYTMNADGSSQTRLTNNAASDEEPAWSPDGAKIAFATDREGRGEIYTMNADGTSQTNITNNPGDDGGPAWSPDGTKIAFATYRFPD